MSSPTEESTGVEMTYSTLVGGRAYHKNLSFATSDDFTEWKTSKNELTKKLVHIVRAYDSGHPLPHGGLEGWASLVKDFAEKYGNHRVPLDIRNAMRDTELNLSVPLTDFGPDTGGYFQPGLKCKK